MSELAEKLRNDLTALGWRTEKSASNTGVDWYAWKRLDGAVDCRCNDKPPCLVITPYEIDVHGKTWSSSEFSVTGEVPSGRWLKLTAYSVPVVEVVDAIPECSALLLSAWNAAAQRDTGSRLHAE